MHVGGVVRGVSGYQRVSRLAIESIFCSIMANGMKSWEIIVSPALTISRGCS